VSIQKKAKAFAEQNLAQCSREIVAWRRTGILKDGKLRELETIVEEMGLDDSTRQAEGFVIQVALEVAAKSDQ
jgi:hypothetical protein